MIRGLIGILSVLSSAAAQVDSDVALLAHARQHVAASIAGFSNYTCQETMDRSITASSGQVEFRERLRLDVIFTTQGELFAWPGTSGFTTESPRSRINSGAIGTGNFGATLHNLFVASNATVHFAGAENRDQQALYRFDFHVPLLSSGYSLTVNGQSVVTAYSGSFWVNKESLDLVRLETRGEEIPPGIDCREVHDSITYSRVPPGADERLLPVSAELAIIHLDGHFSRNSVTFSNCRHYAAETSITFGVAPEPATSKQSHPYLKLSARTTLDLRLEQPISIPGSAAGDLIAARLDKAAKSGDLSLPKGSRVLGRIRRLEQRFAKPASTLVGFEFYAVETTSGRAEFRAILLGPSRTPDIVRTIGDAQEIMPGNDGLEIEDDGTASGVGSFRVRGTKLNLPRGFRTVWKTQ